MKPGDLALIVGLDDCRGQRRHVEILSDPERTVTDDWYACEVIETGETAFIAERNLQHLPDVTRRGICLHLFGREERPE